MLKNRKKIGLILILWMSLVCPLARAQVSSWEILSQTARLHSGGPALLNFLEKSGKGKSDPQLTMEVLQNANRLQEEGLPVDPYLLKANEGLAKGVAPQKIAPALVKTEKQIRTAGKWVQESDWEQRGDFSPLQRRQIIQEYQWALLNGVPPSRLEEWNRGWKDQKGPPRKWQKSLRALTVQGGPGAPWVVEDPTIWEGPPFKEKHKKFNNNNKIKGGPPGKKGKKK